MYHEYLYLMNITQLASSSMTGTLRKYLFLCCISVALFIWLWKDFGKREAKENEIGIQATPSSRGMDGFVGDWVLRDSKNFKEVLYELSKNT